MKTVFLGSGEYARDLLQHLVDSAFDLAGLVTRQDRPAGRGLRTRPTPVKSLADERGLDVLQPSHPSDTEFMSVISELRADLILVADYGFILSRAILDLPRYGCVNIHPSLLPRYRGAAPIRRVLMDGRDRTGVTVMKMEAGLDTGPVIAQEEIGIEESDDAASLRAKLASLGSRMVLDYLPLYISGRLRAKPQDEAGASYAEPVGKEELSIDWSNPALDIFNQVRALSPQPGAYTFLGGKRIKILRALPHSEKTDLPPRMLQVAGKEILLAGTGEGALELLQLQPEGKRAMSSGEFLRGYRPGQEEHFSDTAN